MQLGNYIKSRRINLELTQKQLADKINVTDVTVSRWESGQREPQFNQFVKLCNVLGLKIDDFIEMESEDNDR